MIHFKVNGLSVQFEGDPQTPLLWVIRDELKMTGTKFGCGIGQCGACSVHLDGQLIRSCVTTVGVIKDKSVTTIEGLAEGEKLTPVQQAWIEHDVPQCGYCQAGQIMAATDLLNKIPNPTEADIRAAMTNLCRCGTYVRVSQAIHHAAKIIQERGAS